MNAQIKRRLRRFERQMRIRWSSGLLLFVTLLMTQLTVRAAEEAFHNNVNCVDLSDMRGRLPLKAFETKQILRKSERWENSTWKRGDKQDSVGYPTVVRNDRGKNPDGKYYLYYAHHDPTSGIGCAISKSIAGPYTKLAELDSSRKHSMVLVNPHSPGKPGDPSHYSSPCVVWNEDEQLWFMYFHYYNHFHGAWEADPQYPGDGNQMTALASCADLASHEWTIFKNLKLGEVSVHDIVPVLPTTRKPWMHSESSYHAVARLADGRWLAFLRGTPVNGLPKLGFATSTDGRKWQYFDQNPVIHQNQRGRRYRGIYRPGFVGYLGKNRKKEDEYLLVWTESPAAGDVPEPHYGYTTDFVKIRRDRRGYAKWPAGDGQIRAWREGNRLYLFTEKHVHTMRLRVAK